MVNIYFNPHLYSTQNNFYQFGKIHYQLISITFQLITEIETELLASQVFDHYFDSDGAVKRDKLCRFYGEYLLQSSSVFNLEEFLSIWQDSLPIIDNSGEEPFKVNIGQLEGKIKYVTEIWKNHTPI